MRTAVDVHNFLLERDIAHEMVPIRRRVRGPERVAAVLGLEPRQVGRVVLFEGEGLVAALVPADRSPEPSKVADAAGQGEVREVPADRATDLTEFLHEALPPVGLPPGTRVILDRAFADEEVLYFPGGEATSVLKIRAEDLLAATDGGVAAIS